MSLARVLALLPTLQSGAEVVGKLGEPNYHEKFRYDDPSSSYWPNRMPLSEWKNETIAFPADLLDTMAIGTNMWLYRFGHGSGMNPTTAQLIVCIDDNDRLIGWMYGKALLGHENQSVFMDM